MIFYFAIRLCYDYYRIVENRCVQTGTLGEILEEFGQCVPQLE